MKNKSTNRYLLTLVFLVFALAMQAQQTKPAAADSSIKKDSTLVLQEVIVGGAKKFMEQTAGKITLNVAASPAAAGGTAFDVLTKAPGMTAQQDILQYKGQSLNVLVNGRPSNLSGEELKTMLSAMPAGSVEKIEILSNPSAAYDAQGGVVVNIKLAKNKNFGTNGTLSAGIGAGKYGRYNAGLLLNHRNKNTNVYGSYDILDNKQLTLTNAERMLNSTTALVENENAVYGRQSHVYKAGIDYDINKRNTAGILVKGMHNTRDKDADNSAQAIALAGGRDSSSAVATRSQVSINNPSVNVYYKTLFNGKGNELTLNADYFSYKKTWDDDFTTRYFDEKQQAYRPDDALKNQSAAAITVKAFAADYVHPVKESKWEAGLKATTTTTDNNANWLVAEAGAWKTDAGKTNHFIYREDIYAAYVNHSFQLKKLGIQAGLRTEYTRTTGTSTTLQQVNRNNYINLFPSISLDYTASELHQFGLSYRRSITRFGFEVVNPFVNYISQYSYSQGNPSVRPGFSNNIELSHTYKNKWMSSLGYSLFTDLLAPVFKKEANGDAVISTQENLQSASQASASLTYMEMLLKGKWMMNNTLGAIYAELNDPSGAGTSKTLGAYVSMVNMVTLNKGWTAELSGTYMSPLTIGVLQVKGQGGLSMGVSKTILKKAGKLTVGITDLFNTQRQNYTVSSFGVSSVNSVKPETRAIRLSVSWKFGNKQVKAGKQRQTGIDELKKRTDSN